MPDPRILILTADTGGGHRSVSESLAEAFQEAGQGGVVIVDAFRYLPGPLTQIPKLYLPTINYASVFWRVMYYSLNRQLPGDFLMTKIIYALSARALRRIYREHQPALVVSTHPLFQYGAARVLQGQYPGTPFATMVTDFASAHRWWFTPLTDLCLLPSEELRSVALANRIPPERIHVIGLPVHRAFSLNRYLTRQEARAALGVSECPTLLIVGGGEGMGALGEMAQAVDESLPSMQKLIVAGRNRNLQRQLQARRWAGPTHVYGFVRNMPQLMRAADVIVTKAGPSTLSEALICGLPILISGFVPGQEEGNVRFVIEHQAGYRLQKPAQELGVILKELMGEGRKRLTAIAQNAYALGRPDAAREAVRLVSRLMADR